MVQGAVLATLVGHAAVVPGRTCRWAGARDMGRRNAHLTLYPALAARRASGLLVAANQLLKLVPTLLAGVFINRHGWNFRYASL
jgi:hypothetical protein